MEFKSRRFTNSNPLNIVFSYPRWDNENPFGIVVRLEKRYVGISSWSLFHCVLDIYFSTKDRKIILGLPIELKGNNY